MKTRPRPGGRLGWSFCVVVAVIATGCVSRETAGRSEQGKLLQDAEKYASELKAQDQLPGYGHAEHGHVIASAPWHEGHVSYPASVTVRAWKEGDESTYAYDLVKDTRESPWQLVRATHLDKQEKVIEQMFPK